MNSTAMHILLVEDDPSHADLVRMAVEESEGFYTIDWVSDGAEALAYLQRREPFANHPRPDLVLLDLKLPRLDGYEVLDCVKTDPQISSIPIVVLSACASSKDRVAAYRLYANSFLVKPTEFEPFLEMIKQVMVYWARLNWMPAPTA